MPIENLIKAIKAGNIEEVKKILEQTENLNVRDYMGLSPLHYAVIDNKKDIVELLLAKGADINIEDDVIDEKAAAINPNIMRNRNRILAERAYIQKEQAEGRTRHHYKLGTPFAYLVCSNPRYLDKQDRLEMAKFLISKGADVNVLYNMLAPLVRVTLENDLEMVKLLIENGVFLDYDFTTNRPLVDAVSYGYKELAKYLISAGFKIENICVAAGIGDIDLVKQFFNQKPTLSELERALGYAVKNNNIEIVKFLLSQEIELANKQESYNQNLICSVENNNKEMAELFLSKGADVNAKGNWGKTPLLIACEEGYTELAKILIDKGADVNVHPREDTRTPLHFAKVKNYKEIEKMLIEKKAQIIDERKMCMDCIFYKNSELAKEYFAKYSEHEFINQAFKEACLSNNKEIVSFLLSKGADVNLKYQDIPLLHHLAMTSKHDMFKFLIDNGADIKAKDKYNRTLLHTLVYFATYMDTKELIQLLIEKGLDVNAKDDMGRTPLDYAPTEEIKQILISRGAKSGKDL